MRGNAGSVAGVWRNSDNKADAKPDNQMTMRLLHGDIAIMMCRVTRKQRRDVVVWRLLSYGVLTTAAIINAPQSISGKTDQYSNILIQLCRHNRQASIIA